MESKAIDYLLLFLSYKTNRLNAATILINKLNMNWKEHAGMLTFSMQLNTDPR